MLKDFSRTLISIYLAGCFLAAPVYAANCDLSTVTLVSGEDTDIILCGDQLPANIVVTFRDPDLIKAVYLQPLQRCDLDDKRNGFHVVLNAQHIGETELDIADDVTGQKLCSNKVQVLPSQDQEVPSWHNSMPLEDARYIDVNGIRTRYYDRGKGPALILVHGGQAGGANNSAQKWEQNFTELSRNFRVIALDRLAQAGTDNLPAAEDYAEYFTHDAQHLEDFVIALGLSNVALVGHSQGGWPITRLALNRPDLVSCLVNVDTVMVPDNMELMRQALAFILYTARFTDPPTGPTVHSSRRAMTMRYPSGNNITRAKAQRVVNQYQLPKTAVARKHMSAQRMNPLHPSFKTLKQQAFDEINSGKLSVRSLVIWGEHDPQVPLGLGQEFNALLAAANVDTKLVVIEGAGHAPFVEFPSAFNKQITRFCNGAP